MCVTLQIVIPCPITSAIEIGLLSLCCDILYVSSVWYLDDLEAL